nr:hypothetical protein [Cressdnaviricota sp.]UOF82592.1 hypothetical protein [Cressdnaviricota sp.]
MDGNPTMQVFRILNPVTAPILSRVALTFGASEGLWAFPFGNFFLFNVFINIFNYHNSKMLHCNGILHLLRLLLLELLLLLLFH